MMNINISRRSWVATLCVMLITLFGYVSLVQAQDAPPENPEADIVLPTPIVHPAGEEGENSCYDCHVELGDEHAGVAQLWQKSVHGEAGVGCVGCHGGDPRTDEMILSMSEEAGFIGVPSRSMLPGVCGGCHSDVDRMRQFNLPTDQYIKYIESVHGNKIKEGDTRVALCNDCHGSHNVKKASDPTADVYPLNVPALCARCHSNPDLMEPYGIPTNQYEVYETSVHGEALLGNQDTRAPNCASCHGSHAANPPNHEEVVNVCGKCHTATQGYYEESLHSRIGENAPKCWTCHGTHDVLKTDESMFIRAEPREEEQHCGACHLDDESFRMNKERFALPEDRRCDTCHHEGSWIATQVEALHSSLMEAAQAYDAAEEAIGEAASRGMIVNDAENSLAEAHTSLIQARAVIHTTKLPLVSAHSDDAVSSAEKAKDIADAKLGENLFRRQAMVVAVGAVIVNIGALVVIKRSLKGKSVVSAVMDDQVDTPEENDRNAESE